MEWVETALNLLAAALGVAAVAGVLGMESRLGNLAGAMRRNSVLLAELTRARSMAQVLGDAQAFTEAVVEGGTHVAKIVHFGIASIPFGIFKSLPLTRDTARVVHETHDLIADTVYGTIHGVNRVVGEVARTAIGSPPKPPADSGGAK